MRVRKNARVGRNAGADVDHGAPRHRAFGGARDVQQDRHGKVAVLRARLLPHPVRALARDLQPHAGPDGRVQVQFVPVAVARGDDAARAHRLELAAHGADAAARGIRERDTEGTIGILSADVDPPYTRPALSKKLWTDPEFTWDQVPLGTTDETGAELHLETLVTAIDREAIIARVLDNRYEAATDVIAPFVPGSRDDACETCVYDPEEAKRLYDEAGREVTRGGSGRVFVRSTSPFDGYTGGGHKEVIDGFMSTGDVGHFDSAGRLFIDGRDDEMLVSGGENVFPREVEELLEHHEDVIGVACIGVPDEQHGQRLRAFVVRRGVSPCAG